MLNSFESLKNFEIDKKTTSPELSKKKSMKEIDIFVREIFDNNPDLKERVANVMQKVSDAKMFLPVVHFTTESIVKDDGTNIDPGFLKNIFRNGLRKRDTNVGAFMSRKGKLDFATANNFLLKPEDMIKDLKLLIERYSHHGTRINKQILSGEDIENSRGIPTMLVIDGNIGLEKATDYDDHFITTDIVSPDKVFGKIDINNKDQDGFVRAAEELLDLIETQSVN